MMPTTRQPRTDWAHAQLAVEHYLFHPTETNLSAVFSGYEKLVLRLAHKYTAYAPLDDLIGVGNLGMMVALNLYKPNEGKFSTIAVHYIQGYMRHFLTRKNHTIRTPSWVVAFHQKEERARAVLEAQGVTPTEADLAAELEITVERYRHVMANNPRYNIERIEQFKTNAPTRDGKMERLPLALSCDFRGNAHNDPDSHIKDMFHTLFADAKGKSVMKISQIYRCDLLTAQEIHGLVHEDEDAICNV